MGLERLVCNVSHAKLWRGEGSTYTPCRIEIVSYLLRHVNNLYALEETFIGNHVTIYIIFYEPSLVLMLVKIRPITYYR